jgi:Sigma-70 region 2/Sigma-70 factor, region 1.2
VIRSGWIVQYKMETRDPNDAVELYLREATSVQPLSAAEEAELFRRLGASDDWQGETEDAARRVIESYLRFVVSIAERHAASSGVSVLDLIQEGNIGLLVAIRRAQAPKLPSRRNRRPALHDAPNLPLDLWRHKVIQLLEELHAVGT